MAIPWTWRPAWRYRQRSISCGRTASPSGCVSCSSTPGLRRVCRGAGRTGVTEFRPEGARYDSPGVALGNKPNRINSPKGRAIGVVESPRIHCSFILSPQVPFLTKDFCHAPITGQRLDPLIVSTKNRYPFIDPGIENALYPYLATACRTCHCPPSRSGNRGSYPHCLLPGANGEHRKAPRRNQERLLTLDQDQRAALFRVRLARRIRGVLNQSIPIGKP